MIGCHFPDIKIIVISLFPHRILKCSYYFLQMEEEEPTGYIRFEKFLPVMTHVMMERR